ncbi:MAG: AraC family transcriptional regulator [Dysgonamonadaceae bacterium]|jgi:AraC-like DNA-binding protein/DNA gyrase inhibitor GyrI|nr:AraC family transcriptional regulator [Dysgonamonadaceae bacterium]
MRSDTENIYRQKVNQAIDYISANLHEPLRLDKLASQMNVSQSQLLRIMRSSLDESLSSYIARQRVERAVLYMQAEKMSLTQLAEMVGYDNAQSFSKAFKKHFGISPKIYIDKQLAKLESYLKSSGNRQDTPQSEIYETSDLELVYIRIIGKYGEKNPYETAWNKLFRFLSENQALSEKTRVIGISFDNPNVTKEEQCRFYACASVEKKIAPTGEFGTIRLQKGKYAVSTLRGNYSGLQALYNNISINFGYNLRYGLAFEEYLNSPHNTPEEKLLTKIFIPIK